MNVWHQHPSLDSSSSLFFHNTCTKVVDQFSPLEFLLFDFTLICNLLPHSRRLLLFPFAQNASVNGGRTIVYIEVKMIYKRTSIA